MWEMALQIEDGNVSQATGAAPGARRPCGSARARRHREELKKLMDDLRAAMTSSCKALAEEMRRNPQQLARPLDRNTRMLQPAGPQEHADRLEQMARSGNKDAARQLLEQLQQMNGKSADARPGAQGDDGDDDMSRRSTSSAT